MDNLKLLENRLAFITHNRDKRESFPGIEIFYGDSDFFKNAFLFDEKAINKVPEGFQLHIPDWVSIDEIFLEKHGWFYSESMNYMVLKNRFEKWPNNKDVVVERIVQEQDADRFCQIQSKGFNGENSENDNWYASILNGVKRNVQKSNHYYYLASLYGQPAGVTITFSDGKTLGIYAVATVADFRNQGVSTSLMKEAILRGRDLEIECVTLQTMAGSYAETLYKKLGFERAFECRIFKKQT